jgi:hypothetical protein
LKAVQKVGGLIHPQSIIVRIRNGDFFEGKGFDPRFGGIDLGWFYGGYVEWRKWPIYHPYGAEPQEGKRTPVL